LYFSDFYKDLNYASPIDTGSNILRVRYVGHADFRADFTHGYSPLSVRFTDLSTVTPPGSWLWNLGDGTVSTVQNPTHTFMEDGVYTIRLSVTNGSDVISRQKNAYVIVGDPAIGLSAEYFPTVDLTGQPFRRIDRTVDFDWAEDAPFSPLPADSFSVRWSGRVKSRFGELYTFWTSSEGGVRLSVDEQVIIDGWIEQGPTEHSASVALERDRTYAITLEFYDGSGNARMQLSWSSPSQPKEIIPQASLYGSAPFPAQVRLMDPAANAEIADESVRLVWNGNTPVPDRYWLEVSPDSSFSCGFRESTVVDTARVVAPLRSEMRYYWRVRARNGAGWGPFSETWTFDTRWSGGTTGLEFSVSQNYPNPFGPETQIEYAVPEAGRVTLTVFDVLGRRVKALVQELQEPGHYRRQWDGEDEQGSTVGNGVYFYRLEAVAEGDGRRFTSVRKMIRVR
jgi:PKD repeat protein